MGSATAWCAEATTPPSWFPAPGPPSIATVPPCAATTSATIASPRPAPPLLRDRSESSRTKRSNTRVRSAEAMPGPSSLMAMIACRPRLSTQTSTRDVAWRTALSSKLRIAREIAAESPTIRTGSITVWIAHLAFGSARATSASATSSTGTSSVRITKRCSSARASRSKSSISVRMRCASGRRILLANSVPRSSGWCSAASSPEMIVVNGLRSSCEASPTKRCCAR